MSAYYRDDRGPYVRERSPSRDRTPTFLRNVHRPDAGPMVLRQRDVETASHPHPAPTYIERRRSSPSPSRGRSVSRVRTRLVRRESSESSASSSCFSGELSAPPRRGVVARPRSVSPGWRETVRARFRRESPSPSPSPSPQPQPQPQVVRGPTVEREVITHYTDVDHGVVRARQPSPQPQPQPQPQPRAKSRARHRDTEIDIYTSPHETEVDVIRRDSRRRSPSRHHREKHYHDDHLGVDHRARRRAHSAAPLRDPAREEAEYLTSAIDARGRHGEAYHGSTRDWEIVDVPPGTQRVTMDGAGGASTETTWQRYSGVRRTQFVPEREEEPVPAPAPAPLPEPRKSRDRLSVHVERRTSSRPREPAMETWTEITRDLVNEEAIVRMGFAFEKRGDFFYVMQYLSSREIDHLVEVTDDIRRSRRLKRRLDAPPPGPADHSVVVHSRRHRHHRDSPHRLREEPRFEKQVSYERRSGYY